MWRGASSAVACEYAVSLMLTVHSSSRKWYNVCKCVLAHMHVVSLKLTGVASHLRLVVITANNHYRPLCIA